MTVHAVTCGDLALLGDPWDDLLRHDPRRQYATDPHCHCWRWPAPEDWSPGTDTPPDLPARLLEQHCRAPIVSHPDADLELHVCCLCDEVFQGVLAEQRHRGRTGGALLTWLREQVREALAYRDRRRMDSSPCIADVDLEVAAMEDWS